MRSRLGVKQMAKQILLFYMNRKNSTNVKSLVIEHIFLLATLVSIGTMALVTDDGK